MAAGLAVRTIDRLRDDAAGYGRALRRALWTDAALDLLPGPYGWNDGGCGLLADALLSLVGDDGRLMAIVGNGTTIAQHFAVQVNLRHGDWYLDGSGATRFDTLLRRWERVEGIHGARLTPAANADGRQTPRDPAVSERIAQYIRDHVG